MKYRKLIYFLQNIGKDPDTLSFEDKLTGFGNRRHLFRVFETEMDWGSLHHWPICLLMIGIDDLSGITDQYGQHVEDEVLLYVADRIKPLATEKEVLIRYSTDEFIMVLPGKDKQDGMNTARSLVSAFQENPFFSSEAGMPIPISMGIGVACAPDDADYGKLLINRADTALYHAKKDANGTIVDASDTGRLAIRYVHTAGIVGRKSQFDHVSAGFKDLGQGRNQFFIIDGEPGMGKTSFVDAIQRNLEKTRLKPVRINGVVQETFRPYYLISYIIIALMNQREDKGVEIVESTGKNDLACLLHVIPQLTDESIQMAPGDFPDKTKTVFNAFNRFLSKLVANRTLVVLIDDFDLADPASLDMLYELMANGRFTMFICATASMGKKEQSSATPLTLFRAAYSEPLGIKNIFLNPLTGVDIKKYINLVFPGIVLPDGLTTELARVTGGNPLFLLAIIIKMIGDRKILQSESQWTVAELEKGYFPGSFEQIIKEKLDSLDGRDKQFIDRVSAFGESASLSMLEGFTRQESNQVYEIVKQAVNHGLMRHEFRENDENICFSSKLVREVIYERIGEEEKKKLHEEIGLYHEKLYLQNVLPSPAHLVHHFRQSGNIEKTHTYDQLMAEYNQNVYDPAQSLLDEGPAEAHDTGDDKEIAVTPLPEKGLEIVPEMLRALVISIRNIRLYPEKSDSVTSMTKRLLHLVFEILKTDDRFSIMIERNTLLINAQPMDTTAFQTVAAKIVELWNRLELQSLTIKKGITEEELLTVVRQISSMEKKAVTPKFWNQFAEENNLVHIIPVQMTYAKIKPGPQSMVQSPDLMPEIPAESLETGVTHQFADNEKKAIRQIIGSLLGAFNKIKLYPTRGQVATKAVSQVAEALFAFLQSWPFFTISRIDDKLLVNGIKIDTREFENLADGFLKLLKETGLNSISFTSRTNANEIIEFLKAACQIPPDMVDPDFWQKLAAQKQITGILFNQSIYDIMSSAPGDETVPLQDEETMVPHDQTISECNLDDMPAQARELYLKGDIKGLETLLSKATERYWESEASDKLEMITIFHKVLFPDDWHPNAAYIKLTASHVMTLLASEETNRPLEKLFDLCHECTRTFILFGEYAFASWIYTLAGQRFTAVFPEKDRERDICDDTGNIRVLGRPIGDNVKDAITEDMTSGDRSRQQEVCQLISSMGACMTPLLIDIIKESKELRTRQLAAELIGKHGSRSADMLKKSMVNAWRPKQKARILDVIDMVTTGITNELAYAVSDPDETVKSSAFKLIERLNTPEALSLARDAAVNGDSRTSLMAINTLAKRKPQFLAETLSTILKNSNNPEILIAGCRAIGQTGDAVYISILSELLFPKRRFLRRKKYDTSVRVAAAFALAQLPDEKTRSIMQALRKDPDARIRQVVTRYYPEGSGAETP